MAEASRGGQGVEDEIEAEFELDVDAVLGPQCVFSDLEEMGVLVRRDLLDKGSRRLGDLLRTADRQTGLLDDLSVHEAVEHPEGVDGVLDGETCRSQVPQDCVQIAKGGRPLRAACFEQPDRPRVVAEHLAGRDRPRSHGLFPGGVLTRNLDFANDDFDDAVEDLLLVGNVFVDGHGLDAQFGAQAAHRQGAEPVSIGQLDGGLKDPFSGQGRAGGAVLTECHT